MIIFLATLFVALIGIALAIFGAVAALAGVLWLLWPLLVLVIGFIMIGYLIGRKKETKKGLKAEDAEFKEVDK